VLAGQNELPDVLVPWRRQTLTVLPSGPIPPNPSELLGSQHMGNLLKALAGAFDYVIVDTPPLLPVTDAAVLATLTDGALLITRHGKSSRDDVERAAQSLEAVNARLLGTVLNAVPVRARGGYGYGYGYGYGDERALSAGSARGSRTKAKARRTRPTRSARPTRGRAVVSPREPLPGDEFAVDLTRYSDTPRR
jgi:Mrp family chromosome partitioning ATPase